jgi:hypothetical protein
MSDDVALRMSQQQGYANSTQSAKDLAYADRVAAFEAEKKRQAAAVQAAAAEAAAMQDAVAQDAAAAKVAAVPVVALPKATQNNEQQDRNSLGRQYLLKSLALGSERPDMAAMNEYARQRSQGGDLDMLNSFAAAYAGERYAPNQASHLKRAMAARDPLEVSGGMLTNKGFVEDPYAARERERKSNYEVGKELLDQETKAQDRRSARNPYYTPVSTAQGVRAFNSATGQMELIKDSAGNTSVDYRADPTLAGQISGAKESGKLTAVQRQTDKIADSKQAAMDVQIALGFNKLASNPTGSGIGAGVDSAMGFFGKSTESSRTATALETTAGWLQNNVPRMEGPQSDRDTILYREMAGQIGDRTIPVENRIESLKTLQTLMNEQSRIRRDRIARGEGPVYESDFKPSSEGNAKPSAAPANSGFGEPPPGAVRPKVKK